MSLMTISSRITLALSLLGGIFILGGCGTQPPIRWQENQSYVRQAIADTPPPDVSGMCVYVTGENKSGTISQRNDTYPGRQGPILVYSPREVLHLTINSITSAWSIALPKSKKTTCRQIRAFIVSVAQGLAEGGLGSESPYVCIKLRLSYGRDHMGGSGSELVLGSAIGDTVWWADYADTRMIKAYNHAAYLALVRAFSNGLRKILGEPLIKQPKRPMKARWPKCIFSAPSTRTGGYAQDVGNSWNSSLDR